MNETTFTVHRGSTPLVLSFPHVGTEIPPDQHHRYTERALQVEDTDWFLDRLYAFARELGATLIVPRFSRYLIDLNRSDDNAPMYPGRNNTELCPTRHFTGEPIYREGQAPDAAEIQRRITTCWRPYHAQLRTLLEERRAAHGHAVLFDAHSIKSELPWLFEGTLPHMNLGTAEGVACDAALRDRLAEVFAAQDRFSHVVDGRFKGGHITRHFGRPAERVHAVQLEMCWRAYMEEVPPYRWHEARAAAVTPLLTRLVETLLAWKPARMKATLWAPAAWVNGAWADEVLLRVGDDGHWAEITAGQPCPPDAERLPGPVLPGLVNAHSHAFQRAFVGLAERRDSEHDDFWSWRDRMYRVALRITPEQLHAVACHLYAELLQGGYTHTCEFHYLHHAEDGRPYAAEATMCRALAQAAQDTGMGLTLLPVLYERAGFARPALRADQRRFAADAARVLRLRDAVRGWRLPNVEAGVAVHSLRAARAESIRALRDALQGDAGPIHIHVAEQTAEVDDCLAATGARPIEWLAREGLLDARWQLVHATHTVPAEIEAVAASGAGVVLCPGTEANLGDGLADLPRWLAGSTPLSLGSDSHVTRSWPEELRWLEYGQRLALRQRNVAADAATQPATAARLFERVLAGGAAAAGWMGAGLRAGTRADAAVLDPAHPAFIGVPASHLLDAAVFGAAGQPFVATMVAGRLARPRDTTPAMASAMQTLHLGGG